MPVVLIVDDNEKNRKLAGSVLSAACFRTIEAATGSEGLALAAEHLPDVGRGEHSLQGEDHGERDDDSRPGPHRQP